MSSSVQNLHAISQAKASQSYSVWSKKKPEVKVDTITLATLERAREDADLESIANHREDYQEERCQSHCTSLALASLANFTKTEEEDEQWRSPWKRTTIHGLPSMARRRSQDLEHEEEEYASSLSKHRNEWELEPEKSTLMWWRTRHQRSPSCQPGWTRVVHVFKIILYCICMPCCPHFFSHFKQAIAQIFSKVTLSAWKNWFLAL